jgi:uncharacterized protein (DUF924 family)
VRIDETAALPTWPAAAVALYQRLMDHNMDDLRQDSILDFWFGRPGSAEYGTERDFWFRKDPAFDRELRARFGSAIDTALQGGFSGWSSPRGTLARILLLDQFTRDSFRETPRAFAGDALALSLAGEATARGDDRNLANLERWFMYMPYVHAESLAAQERSLELFRALSADGLGSPLPWAERHAEVIRPFGRFTHPNAILGRASTPEEIAFLSTHGSRF